MRKAKMALLISLKDQVKLDLYQEGLRSNTIDFEIRNGTDIFVPENELEMARIVIQEGQWEY